MSEERGRSGLDPAVARVAWTVLVGGMAVIFDTTIVAIGIKTIATDLEVGLDVVPWVSTAYLLALGVAVPLVGWAQRALGAKRLWMIALSIFLLGSVLCSLAWDIGSLIAFRAVQGVGGGILMPLMMTMVMQAAGGKNLGRLAAVIGMPVALGPVLGPVIGGLILQYLHWSWLFWVNVPFCVAGLVLAWKLLPRDGAPTRARLDVVGLLLLAPGLVGLLYGLSSVAREGSFTHASVLVPGLGGVALLAVFVLWAARRGSRALVDVGLLRHRPLAMSSVLMFLSGFGLFGAMFLLPLYFQTVRGADVLHAGLLLIPQGLGTLLSRTVIGRHVDRIPPRWLSMGSFLLVGLATVPFALASETTDQWWLMAVLLVRGLGLGVAIIPLMAYAFVGVPHDDIPDASIVSRIIQQLGGSFGTAILATVLAGASASVHDVAGLADAFDGSFWTAVAFTALAVVLCFGLPATVGPQGEPAPSEDRADAASELDAVA